MSESQQETAAPQTDTPQDEGSFDGDFDADRAKTLIAELRADKKKLSNKLGEALPKLEHYDRLVAGAKTDLERATETAAEAQKRAESAERVALVYEVAVAKGIPQEHLHLLHGDDRETLETNAAEIKALIDASQAAQSPRAPRVDRSQGSSSSANGGVAASPGQEFASLIQRQLAR